MKRCMTLQASALAALLVTAGCGSRPDDSVGDVTASEARALNDAAEMLDGHPRPELDINNKEAPPPAEGQ